MGSSPHARGTRFVDDVVYVESGIIPACAGNTSAVMLSAPCSRDHPRMRGEHMDVLRTNARMPGSSPHARGTQQIRNVEKADRGIIPACAGNTNDPCPCMMANRDHPRMRGEHWLFVFWVCCRLGSSPHARGTPAFRRSAMRCRGIIPACAGNTPCNDRLSSGSRDHPRMRGEHYTLRWGMA